jgi:2-methylcitrate dehydratase
MMTLAHLMAEFVFSVRYEDIPPDVAAAARRHLADSVACALGASNSEAAQVVRGYALEQGEREESTIIGAGRKVSAAMAALANGTMVRYLDANDIFALSRGHESGHFSDGIPALIALAEHHRRSGQELLTCLVAAYELHGALAESFHFMRRGFHSLTQLPWAIPIVAARLMGAGPQEAVHACGLSGATGMVLNTWLKPSHSIPMIKAVAVGLAAQRAVEAAELAAMGVTASEDALETAFARLGPFADPPADTRRMELLGQRWTTMRNIIKAYPAQIYTQAAIEASLELCRRGVRADRISKLTLYGHRNVCGGVQGSPEAFAPSTREAADHSTPYVMAMALLRGRMTLREYDGAPWESPEVKRLMSRIALVREPERDLALDTDGILGVRLVAELGDGRREEVAVHQPRGHPDAPFSDAELLDKMAWLLEDVAPPGTPQRLLELCQRLSTTRDVEALIELYRLK